MLAMLFGLLVSVTAQADCLAPWGENVVDGTFVTAWQQPHAPLDGKCVSELRYCQSGWLSGSYMYKSCVENDPPNPIPRR